MNVLRVLAMAVWMLGPASLRAAEPEAIFPEDAEPELLWSEGEFTEGAVSAPDGCVYFSDIAGQVPGRILRFDPATGNTSVYSADSKKSNGLAIDAEGNLIACCGAGGGARALGVVSTTGEIRPFVSTYEGKQLNSPNDLDVHPRGWIYFSDPRYGAAEGMELDHMSVYRHDRGSQRTVRVTRDISKPNGVVISPDGKTLYVAETDNGSPRVAGVESSGKVRMTLNAFPIDDQGDLGDRRILKDFGNETGVDGMTVDAEGRIFAAVRAESRFGIAVYDPSGKELAFLKTREVPTNCSFGRKGELSVLYVTAGKSLYRVPTRTRGWFPF